MLLSHLHKFIFIKSVKTASTSVELHLEHLCAPPGHIIPPPTPMLETEFGIIGDRSGAAEKPRFYNHITPDLIRERVPAEVWERYVKVTTVRNPFDRIVSAFHFFVLWRAKRSVTTDEIPGLFREWLAGQSLGTLSMKRFIVLDGQPCIDIMIRYEDLSGTIEAFLDRIGAREKVQGPLPQFKTHMRQVELPLVAYYDQASRDLVVQKAELDFEQWGYSLCVADADVERARVVLPDRTQPDTR